MKIERQPNGLYRVALNDPSASRHYVTGYGQDKGEAIRDALNNARLILESLSVGESV